MSHPESGFIQSIHHIKVDYDPKTYCGHPRQCGMKNFGNGELAVLYWRAPCNYETEKDVSHSQADGYQSRAKAILRRSLDHGQTWLPENDVVVWDETKPVAERMRFLGQDPAGRELLDMSVPEAMYFFGRTTIFRPDPTTGRNMMCEPVFLIRSADKGHTWERVPVTIPPPPGMTSILKDNHPLATLPDGAVVGAFTAGQPGSVWLYGSENYGMTWQCLSRIAVDKAGAGRPTYANLILLPSGRLQCYMLMLSGGFHALCMSESDDCFTWSEPRPIVRYGHGPWATRWEAGAHRGVLYRSPWPLRLRDGRIVVVFARREYPAGIAALLSEDDGKTWSDAAIIRDDASGGDLGYPVATELDDGRIFTAYYYQLQDGNQFDGTRFIGGSFFALR